ncbi:MAG: hypothetical protein EZS28_052741, partial [Streblomastix strix]
NDSPRTISLINILKILIIDGSDQTRQEVQEKLPILKIKELTRNKDSNIQIAALYLLSWISDREEMIKFDKYEKIVEKTDGYSNSIIDVNVIMKDIITIIREGRSNIEQKGGLVFVAIKVAEKIILENKQFVEQGLQEGGFIDELFKFYGQVPPDQIVSEYVYPLVQFADLTTDKQQLHMKLEKYINPLIHLLDQEWRIGQTYRLVPE